MAKREELILATIGLVVLSRAAALGDEPYRVREVVVTATRTRTDLSDAVGSIELITAEESERRNESRVADALRGAVGVDVMEFGSPGHGAFVSIRGAAPDQVLTLLDGVEVNSPTVGQFDYSNLTLDGVGGIEVLRGGGGTLYGSQAIGGVVNVLTHRGEGAPRVTTAAEVGRGFTHHEQVGVEGAHGPFAVAGSLSYDESDGFRSTNDDYRNLSTVWRGDADPLPRGTLTAILRYTTTRAGLPDFNVSQGVIDPDARDHDDFFLAKGEWNHELGDAFHYRTAVAYVRNNERFVDDTIDEEGESEPAMVAHFPTELIQAEAQVDHHWSDIALTTIGLEFKERSADIFEFPGEGDDDGDGDDDDDDRRAHSTGEAEPEGERFRANRSNVAVYLQEQLSFFDDRLRGVGGFRYDHIDDFGDQVTFSGSGSYRVPSTGTRFRVGYQQGFRAPTFEELFEPGLGDPDLEAEESWEIDAGVSQDLFGERLRCEATYFYRPVEDLIQEVADVLPGPVAGVPEDLRAENLDVVFQGVELIAASHPLSWLTLSASYTYVDADSASEALVNRPQHQGSVGATGEWYDVLGGGDKVGATLRVYGVGSRFSPDPFSDTEPFTPARTSGYSRTDLALAYRFGGRWAPLTLTATVRNLFDRDYEESIGFPAPPARFLFGLRYQLEAG